MISLDEDALTCDFAETYHIYDIQALPLRKVAVLACGLRDNSRIKMKMSDMKIDYEEMLLATIADRLSILIWQNTPDGSKGVNMPKSILNNIMGIEQSSGNVKAFESGEEFMRAWNV